MRFLARNRGGWAAVSAITAANVDPDRALALSWADLELAAGGDVYVPPDRAARLLQPWLDVIGGARLRLEVVAPGPSRHRPGQCPPGRPTP